ncbi:hypothetical protein BC829DRAFT_256488 [Chytridium lagenaria]|nr:hypothetical protein BC829DRAFT_256488 [Chytridium lagenaria]
MSSSGGGLGLSTSTSSFSDLFGGSDDIFAGLDSISTTSSPRDNDFLSLSLPGSARNSIIGDDSTTRNSLSFTNLNATSTSTSSTPTGVASPSGIASAFRSLSYSNPAAPTTPTATTSTTTSASATNSATTSPRSSIQFPRFGSLSRTVNNASRDAGVSSNLASGGGSIERSLSPTSPTLREGTPVPPARNSTKSVVASSGIGILSSGSAAAAAMITGKFLFLSLTLGFGTAAGSSLKLLLSPKATLSCQCIAIV